MFCFLFLLSCARDVTLFVHLFSSIKYRKYIVRPCFLLVYRLFSSFQKMTKLTVRLGRPAKTQISLRIRAVWSESSLNACAFDSLRAIQRGINENPCYTGWMYRLIWVFAGHAGFIVGFVKLCLECFANAEYIVMRMKRWSYLHRHSLIWFFYWVHIPRRSIFTWQGPCQHFKSVSERLNPLQKMKRKTLKKWVVPIWW